MKPQPGTPEELPSGARHAERQADEGRAIGARSFDFVELASLRQEVLLRIGIQNLLLWVTPPMLLASIVAIAAMPRAAGAVALGLQAAVGSMALIWCHHGVRQVQLKRYLLRLEASLGAGGGWESWLPANRVGGRLGSRWFVSTKGVFLGCQMAAGIAAALFGAAWAWLAAGLAVTATTGWFLLVNPKE